MFILFNIMHVRALFIAAVCCTKVSNVSQLCSTDQPKLITGQPRHFKAKFDQELWL